MRPFSWAKLSDAFRLQRYFQRAVTTGGTPGNATVTPLVLTLTLLAVSAVGKATAAPAPLSIADSLQSVAAQGRAVAAPSGLTLAGTLATVAGHGRAATSVTPLGLSAVLASSNAGGAGLASIAPLDLVLVLQPGSASGGTSTPGDATVTPLALTLTLANVIVLPPIRAIITLGRLGIDAMGVEV